MFRCDHIKNDGTNCLNPVHLLGTLCWFHGFNIKVMEYNILADYMAFNYFPWFWYDNNQMTTTERTIMQKLYNRVWWSYMGARFKRSIWLGQLTI